MEEYYAKSIGLVFFCFFGFLFLTFLSGSLWLILSYLDNEKIGNYLSRVSETHSCDLLYWILLLEAMSNFSNLVHKKRRFELVFFGQLKTGHNSRTKSKILKKVLLQEFLLDMQRVKARVTRFQLRFLSFKKSPIWVQRIFVWLSTGGALWSETSSFWLVLFSNFKK